MLCCAVLCCAVLCCAALRCAVLCCAVLCDLSGDEAEDASEEQELQEGEYEQALGE